MKALVLNAPGRGFDLDEVDIASPTGREVLVRCREAPTTSSTLWG